MCFASQILQILPFTSPLPASKARYFLESLQSLQNVYPQKWQASGFENLVLFFKHIGHYICLSTTSTDLFDWSVLGSMATGRHLFWSVKIGSPLRFNWYLVLEPLREKNTLSVLLTELEPTIDLDFSPPLNELLYPPKLLLAALGDTVPLK